MPWGWLVKRTGLSFVSLTQRFLVVCVGWVCM